MFIRVNGRNKHMPISLESISGIDVAPLATLGADIADAEWAIADYLAIERDLGITSGQPPRYFPGRGADGRLLGLYTREIDLPPTSRFFRKEPFRRLILAAYGSDEDGTYLETSDLLVDKAGLQIRFGEVRHRTDPARGHREWQRPTRPVPPILTFNPERKEVKFNANNDYEDELFDDLRPASTAVIGLFRARSAKLIGTEGIPVTVGTIIHESV